MKSIDFLRLGFYLGLSSMILYSTYQVGWYAHKVEVENVRTEHQSVVKTDWRALANECEEASVRTFRDLDECVKTRDYLMSAQDAGQVDAE